MSIDDELPPPFPGRLISIPTIATLTKRLK